MKSIQNMQQVSRRTLLKGTAAAGALAAFPFGGSMASITHRRKSLQGNNALKDLENYKIAVGEMLALPPDDPRNWYRNALTHLLDCPHGNWWFLVWHRGYLGWFEQICRELCGDHTFSLPYWDWTQETKIPDAFWDGVFDTNAPEYSSDLDAFQTLLKKPVEDYWNGFDQRQKQQLSIRGQQHGYSNFEEFWALAEQMFFPQGSTRSRTQSDPGLTPSAKAAVRSEVIMALLAPRHFQRRGNVPGFESARSNNHHIGRRDQSMLEGQPHNLIHGAIGGFMGSFLSPTDPLFFLHHCNIDRLWDVWTRKQQAAGLPVGPEGSAKEAYIREEFVFFSDDTGNPVTNSTASDYFSVSEFGYDYEPGTGEGAVNVSLAASLPTTDVALAEVSEPFGFDRMAKAVVTVPAGLAGSLTASANDENYARITIIAPEDAEGLAFDVYLAAKGQSVELTPGGQNYAGSFAFFGKDHHPQMPSTFTIAVTEAVRRLRASGALAPGDEIDIAVSASSVTGTVPAAAELIEGRLTAVEIGAV